MSYFATLKLGEPAPQRRRAVSQAQVQLGQSDALRRPAGVQLHGGIGVTDEYIGSHYFKRLTVLETELRRHAAPPRRGQRAHAGHGRRLRLTVPLFPGDLADVAGLAVGHHTRRAPARPAAPSSCARDGAVCGVDVRGAAPGTRETDLLRPDNLVEQVHAVLLAGGSAFGLDAASGVMRWLDERGHGFAVGPARVPIVPAAVLFDLWVGDARIRPDARAATPPAKPPAPRRSPQGNVGAGAGATVGKLFGIERAMKGGIGSASLTGRRDHGRRARRRQRRSATSSTRPTAASSPARAAPTAGRARGAGDRCAGELPARALAGMATTIGVVATDAALTKAQATQLATMAHDGLARAIVPVHTMADGDTLFALATGRAGRPGEMTVLGVLAAEVTARAVLQRRARGDAALAEPPLPAARDLRLKRCGSRSCCTRRASARGAICAGLVAAGLVQDRRRGRRRPGEPTSTPPASSSRSTAARGRSTPARRSCCCTSRPATSARSKPRAPPERAEPAAARRCARAACSRSAASTRTPPACCC